MMVRREEFLALGGFYEPLFMYGEEADYCLRAPGRVVLHPGAAIRHDMGHAAGPARSLPRLYHPARNRLVNAARHLPPLAHGARRGGLGGVRRAHARAGAASGRGRAPCCAAGCEGLRAIRRERRARRPDERRRPRAGWSACARPWRSSAVWDACEPGAALACPACGGGCPTRPRSTAATGSTASRVSSRSTSARRAGAGGRCRSCRPSGSASSIRRDTTPTRLPDNPLLRAAATGAVPLAVLARAAARRRSPRCCAARRAGCSMSGQRARRPRRDPGVARLARHGAGAVAGGLRGGAGARGARQCRGR